jgi:hypothetical protein
VTGLRRLDVGQRVFVLADEGDSWIGIWGTVRRLRRLDDGAWVELDRRHEFCPFPASDPTRSKHVLTYPNRCSSVECERPGDL